mmetsp:Transcript_21151/g.51035  ORF Transcript_21151/g.51035 Transcript_21151/m.51035 type:complete len:203 (-) Transcript_21151:240-848(-)
MPWVHVQPWPGGVLPEDGSVPRARGRVRGKLLVLGQGHRAPSQDVALAQGRGARSRPQGYGPHDREGRGGQEGHDGDDRVRRHSLQRKGFRPGTVHVRLRAGASDPRRRPRAAGDARGRKEEAGHPPIAGIRTGRVLGFDSGELCAALRRYAQVRGARRHCWRLQEQHVSLERSSVPGGLMWSERKQGFSAEPVVVSAYGGS